MLWQILPDQAIDLFIQATLPSLVRLGEIELGLQFIGNGFMVGKLSAVVGGNRVNSASMRVQALDYLLLHGRGGFVSYLAEQSKLAFAFDGTDDRATMVFADDGVNLPIADTFFGGDDLRSLFDTNAIRDFTAEIMFSVAFAFFLMAGDLFRRVFLTDLTFDIGNRLGRHFNRLAGVLTALLGPAVRLFGPITRCCGPVPG